MKFAEKFIVTTCFLVGVCTIERCVYLAGKKVAYRECGRMLENVVDRAEQVVKETEAE